MKNSSLDIFSYRKYAKNIFDFLLRKYGGMRIKWKILISYILLITITVFAIGFFSFKNTVTVAQYRYIDALENTLNQLAVDLGNRMAFIEESAEILAWRTELRDILSKDLEEYSFSEQMQDMEVLERIVQVSSSMDSLQLSIYIKNKAIYSRERRNFFPIEESPFHDLDKRTMYSGDQILWGTAEISELHSAQPKMVIACVRPIMHKERIFEDVGMLVFSLNKEIFNKRLEQSRLTPECNMALLDSEGKMVASSGKFPDMDIINRVLGYENEVNYYNTNYHILCTDIPKQDWKLVSFVPEKDINSPITDVIHLYIPLIIIILTTALVLSAFLSTSLTGRISRLATIMNKKTLDSDDVLLVDVVYDDEIGELQRAYNQMITNNQQLINQVYRAEIRERNAEMKALQAQINPHFLYNTLDTINWMALEAGAKRVSGIVNQLANFFRMSLKSGKNIITVAEEVEHAVTYLEIQKYRLDEGIEYTIDVDPSVYSCPAIKLTLQPLVENAVIHGIQKSPTQSGVINIYGYSRNEVVYLVVEDNGPGFRAKPEHVLSMREEYVQSGGGYGIYNTDKRIKLAFGEQFGLRYEVPDTGGTRAIISLPRAIPDSEEAYRSKSFDL